MRTLFGLILIYSLSLEAKVLLETKSTTFESAYDGITYLLKINGKPIYKFEQNLEDGPKFIYQKITPNRDAFLGVLSIYQGDGCPSMNVIVAVKSAKEFVVTEPFGNCQDPLDIKLTESRLILEYTARTVPGSSFPAATWTFQNKRLVKKIKK